MAKTPKLNLLLIDEQKQFADESFNEFINDADNRLVGIKHVQDASHWTLWKPNTNYTVGDIVRYTNLKSSQYAYCIVAGQTDATEPSNNVTGSIITSGTTKFQVLDIATGTSQDGIISLWLSGVYYKRGDVVQYGDVLYRCTRPHEATTFEANKNNWQEIFASLRKWKKQTFYNVGDTVLNDGVAYECKTAHTSENTFKEDNWERLFEVGVEFSADKQYYKGDIVRYAKNLYKAKKDSKENFKLENWEKITDVIKFWDTSKNEPYVNGDTAVVHNTLVTVGNIGTTDLDSKTKPLNASIATYDINALKYPVGTTVEYKGSLYKKILDDNESDFTSFTNAVTAGSWAKISNNQISRYDNSKTYVEGDIVFAEGAIYRAKKGGNGHKPPNDEYWEALSSAFETLIKDWKPSTKYKKDQAISYNGCILRVKSEHTSGATIDFNNFEILYDGISTHDKSKMYKKDSIVKTDDGNLYYSLSDVPTNTEVKDVDFWKRLTPQATLNDWEPNVKYITKDILVKDGNIYRAIADSKDSVFDATKFERLVKNDFVQIDEWSANKDYEKDQVLTYNNLLIKSTEKHNSGAAVPQEKYKVLYASIPQWERASYYPAGSVVRNTDGTLYYSVADVKDKDLSPDDWRSISSLNDWTSGKQYFEKDVVWHDRDLYRAKKDSKNSQFDVLKWEKITQNGTVKISTWESGRNYDVGDVVKSPTANIFYYVAKKHTSSDIWKDIGEQQNLVNLIYVKDFVGEAYSFGEIVRYKGKLYRAKMTIESKSNFDIDQWDVLDYSQAIRDWEKKTFYEKDSLITIYDISYQVKEDFNTEDVFNEEFHHVKPQYSNIAEWREGAHYKEGVTVVSEGKLYKCLKDHKSVHGGAGYVDAIDKWFITNYPNGVGIRTWWWPSGSDFENTPVMIEIPINNALVYDIVFRYGRTSGEFEYFKVIRVNNDNSEEEIYSGILPPNNPLKIYDRIKKIKLNIGRATCNKDAGNYMVLDDVIPTYKNPNWKLIGDVTKIPDWQKYKKYEKEDVVYHEKGLYRCKKDHEDVEEFSGVYWDSIGGSGGSSGATISDWKPTFDYSSGDMVFYDGKLYRAPHNIAGATTFQSDWDFVNDNTFAKNWVANQEYEKDEVVVVGNSLYRAKAKVKKVTFDDADWEKLSQNVSLAEWKPSTMYKKGDVITYNNSIYRAASDHTSIPAFEIDKWESLSGGGAGGTVAGWKQITKLNTTGNTKVTINFPETLNFCFPPIDVLQLQPGANNVLLNSYTFDVGDGGRFEYNENNVVFDGKVHCNTNIKVPMTEPTALGSGFTCMSDEIDFSEYNSVEGVQIA